MPFKKLSVRVACGALAMLALSTAGCRNKNKAAADDTTNRPQIVFLHGIFKGKGEPTEWSNAKDRLERAGFSVWTPLGRRGLCDWSKDEKDSICWPSDERGLAVAREIVSEWQPKLSKTQPVVVVGFSNGGAFATLLAVNGLVPACGFATLHGFPPGTLRTPASKRAPLLLVAGRAAEWEPGLLASTTTQLQAAGWPHEAKTHDGGHKVSDADLDDVIAFARKAVANCAVDGSAP